jgi:hypothetical protein|tara:strand:- start:118 stop:333 length:216 start_codon:yes stop_codon:yes gene_type:complete
MNRIMTEDKDGFIKLTANEYRQFDMWIAENNEELYQNKIAYETRWAKDQFFYVKLLDESVITFNDIPLDKE